MMKVAKRAVVLLGVALFNTANAAEALPEDFVTAKPQVQLYMAYAEFKIMQMEIDMQVEPTIKSAWAFFFWPSMQWCREVMAPL